VSESPEQTPRDEAVLAALGRLARREVAADESDRALPRALATFRRARAPRRGPAVWLVAAALAGLVAAALVIGWPRAPLGYAVEGAPAAAGGYVHAPAAGPAATVRFTDGSTVTFAAGAGGRVAEVGPRGARVLLESGSAAFHVIHLPAARWSVEAGPFVIAVIGTTFDVRWSADAQELDVRLREGAVVVRGPLAPRGVELRAGQHLVARVADGEIRLDEGAPTAAAPVQAFTAAAPLATSTVAAPVPASAAPAPVEAPPHVDPAPPATTTPAPSAPGAAPPASWPKRVAAGDFRGVVADAEARGLEASLRQASLPDLVALADAARYAGRADLARRALLAERGRFVGSPEAHAAAFLLGRLADDAAGPATAAVDWYDRYLAEAPGGVFAAEALGRKLAALQRAGDPAARTTAATYLRLHPEGPHAARAREILAAP
jgi:ferric-dicitrate binding protein FerR (iron transport regulator)